jgi:hypothetical protein
LTIPVIIPYTPIAPGVREAIAATGHKWEEIYVGNSDQDYFSLFALLCAKGSGFIVLEHDVIVRPDTLDELEACPEPWCAFPVPYLGGEYPGMACAKFTDRIIAACPGALIQVGTMGNDQHSPGHWCTTDHFLQMVVLPAAVGHYKHVHPPALGHYRADGLPPMPSHGCVQRST